ncbi:restriction endonuclease [Enterococcus avium]|uniref:restriction endonuclease n=1 Tax=Enterococcus avium TaxID=33945 RepID=UPI001F57A6F3|nr:restriction endonuclease [Enterococcus avium]
MKLLKRKVKNLSDLAKFFFRLAVILCGTYYFNSNNNFLIAAIIFALFSFLVAIYPLLSEIKKFSRAQIETIDNMDGFEFEKYTKYLLEHNGYSNVRLTQKYGDQGIDVIAKKDNVKIGIQCKRWKKKVGNKAVQEVHAGIGYYSLDKGIVLTNSSFTNSAKELAKKLSVDIWDRSDLIFLIENMKKNEKKRS